MFALHPVKRLLISELTTQILQRFARRLAQWPLARPPARPPACKDGRKEEKPPELPGGRPERSTGRPAKDDTNYREGRLAAALAHYFVGSLSPR